MRGRATKTPRFCQHHVPYTLFKNLLILFTHACCCPMMNNVPSVSLASDVSAALPSHPCEPETPHAEQSKRESHVAEK